MLIVGLVIVIVEAGEAAVEGAGDGEFSRRRLVRNAGGMLLTPLASG